MMMKKKKSYECCYSQFMNNFGILMNKIYLDLFQMYKITKKKLGYKVGLIIVPTK